MRNTYKAIKETENAYSHQNEPPSFAQPGLVVARRLDWWRRHNDGSLMVGRIHLSLAPLSNKTFFLGRFFQISLVNTLVAVIIVTLVRALKGQHSFAAAVAAIWS